MDQAKTHDAVACTQCGCVCDDLSVAVQHNRVVAVEGACDLARPWFLALGEDAAAGAPACLAGGAPVDRQAAVDAAAELLCAARSPVVCLAPQASVAASRAAVALADRLGAVVDVAGSRAASAAAL
ncbi:MAG: hypothetical protein KDA41_22860, partial [Planctomycetales bacterium]|nr:hypothetical protein [Planctomycetales bacterium]